MVKDPSLSAARWGLAVGVLAWSLVIGVLFGWFAVLANLNHLDPEPEEESGG